MYVKMKALYQNQNTQTKLTALKKKKYEISKYVLLSQFTINAMKWYSPIDECTASTPTCIQ